MVKEISSSSHINCIEIVPEKAELISLKESKSKLKEFHEKISEIIDSNYKVQRCLINDPQFIYPLGACNEFHATSIKTFELDLRG